MMVWDIILILITVSNLTMNINDRKLHFPLKESLVRRRGCSELCNCSLSFALRQEMLFSTGLSDVIILKMLDSHDLL